MGVVVEATDLLVCPRCNAVFRTGFRACPHDGELLIQNATDPLIGTLFAQRYHIESLVGEGGIGRVYKARHARMSRRYALKVPFGEVAYDPKVRMRFANEAEAASRLSHPNVVGVVDFGETDQGLLYMVMDYAEGKSLGQLIADQGPLAREWVLRFMRQLAEGLAHAHDRGLVHRDLKPDNIIIERDGDRPRIVDFGLAIFREQEGGRITTQGTVLGTPHYMAPEQATGQEIDQRTDLFALGLVLYEMLAGVLPFDGTPVQVARRNLSSAVPRIAERVPGLEVDANLETLAQHLMAKRPDDRPPTAHAVIDMLGRIERDQALTWKMDALEMPAPAAAPAPTPPAGPVAATTSSAPAVLPVALVPVASSPLEPSVAERLPATPTDDIAVLGAGRRRMIAAALGALALLLGGLVVWRLARSPDEPQGSVAAATPDAAAHALAPITVDAAALPTAAVDAAAAIATAPADAAPAIVPTRRRDARASVAVRRADARSTAPPPIDARVAVVPPRAIDAPPPAPMVKFETLRVQYDRLGATIDKLVRARHPKAEELHQIYKDLPFLDARSNTSLRPDLVRRMNALQREVDTLP